MSVRVAGVLAAVLLVSPAALAGDKPTTYAKVLDILGRAESAPSEAGPWAPLAPAFLRTDQGIRTGSKSAVQIAFDRNLQSGAELQSDSLLLIRRGPPTRLILSKGAVLVVNERENSPEAFMTVETADLTAQSDLGGFEIEATDEGTWVKVFGGMTRVTPRKGLEQTVGEGYKFFLPKKGSKKSLERMGYSDYVEWQVWMKAFYRKKDALVAKALKAMTPR